MVLGLFHPGEVAGRNHDRGDADGERVVARHQERLAAARGRDDARRRDRRGRFVARNERRQRRDVAIGAVGVARTHHHAVRVAGFEHEFRRHHLDGGDAGDFGRIGVRALLQPAQQRRVEFAVGLEPLAAGVRDRARRLAQEQAFLGNGEVHPPARLLAREAEVVAVRIEAEEREAEPVLAARSAVARAGVAAGAREDGHHVEAETGRTIRERHAHGDRFRLTADAHLQLALAAGDRRQRRAVEPDDFRHDELGLRRHVARDAAGDRLNDDRLAVARRREFDLRRRDDDLQEAKDQHSVFAPHLRGVPQGAMWVPARPASEPRASSPACRSAARPRPRGSGRFRRR